MSYIGRLAPSPTGLLHIGHARTFWIARERARAADGRLLLRDEDLDPQRSRVEFAEAMREDLRWLGIAWDGDVRQSERLPMYRAAMEALLAAGLAYACGCSRRDLAVSTQAPQEDDDEPIYNGRCRALIAEPSAELLPDTNYRFGISSDEPVVFSDLSAGPQRFVPGVDFGDFILWRKDGLPSYQLACVVDDAFTEITEVVRGRDLLKSTARQILLQRALGYATPDYFHTDLMLDAKGVRLAKRHDALSLRALRDAGVTAEQIRAMF